MTALSEEPGRVGSFARGLEGYERKDLGTGISLYDGSDGQIVDGSSTGYFEIWLNVGLGGGASLSVGTL
jgi:hypothetical protein